MICPNCKGRGHEGLGDLENDYPCRTCVGAGHVDTVTVTFDREEATHLLAYAEEGVLTSVPHPNARIAGAAVACLAAALDRSANFQTAPNNTELLETVRERADALLNGGTLADKDGTVYRTFAAPAELRDDLAEALADLQLAEEGA